MCWYTVFCPPSLQACIHFFWFLFVSGHKEQQLPPSCRLHASFPRLHIQRSSPHPLSSLPLVLLLSVWLSASPFCCLTLAVLFYSAVLCLPLHFTLFFSLFSFVSTLELFVPSCKCFRPGFCLFDLTRPKRARAASSACGISSGSMRNGLLLAFIFSCFARGVYRAWTRGSSCPLPGVNVLSGHSFLQVMNMLQLTQPTHSTFPNFMVSKL